MALDAVPSESTVNVKVLKVEEEEKRKDYTFRRQLNEKPSIITGCPGEEEDANGARLHRKCAQ